MVWGWKDLNSLDMSECKFRMNSNLSISQFKKLFSAYLEQIDKEVNMNSE